MLEFCLISRAAVLALMPAGPSFGTGRGSHRPSDDASAEGVQHDGEEQEARPRGHVGNIGDPQAVGPVHLEIPVDEVGGGTGVVIANRGAHPLAPVNTLNASLAH